MVIAYANLVTECVSDPDSYRDQTKVTWSNASIMKYPMNIMVSIKEKTLAKDMDTSLSTLKDILRK